jgi:hypothetical protein
MLTIVPQHGHLRADAITRTGVIEPYYIRELNPVNVARHVIDPFLESVRGIGPAVAGPSTTVQATRTPAFNVPPPKLVMVRETPTALKPSEPGPQSSAVVGAAINVAAKFSRGQSATVRIGAQTVTLKPGKAAPPGSPLAIQVIADAANKLVYGQCAVIRVRDQRVQVCIKGGKPVVTPWAAAPGARVPTITRPTPLPSNVPVRGQQASGTMYGPVVKHPYHAIGQYARQQTFMETPYDRVTLQAQMAHGYTPRSVDAARAALRSPISNMRQQVAPAGRSFDQVSRTVKDFADQIASRFRAPKR